MRISKKKWVFFCVLLWIFVLPVSLFAKQSTIAVVDMRRVFREARFAQELAKDFYNDVELKRKEIEKKEKELKRKQTSFKSQAKALSKKERQAELKRLKEEERRLRQMKADSEDRLRKERERVRIKIMMKVNKVIEEYAKKHHYTVVLPKGVVLYSDSRVDITEDIIKALNKSN